MPSSTAQKLGINPGGSVLILGTKVADATAIIGELPDRAAILDGPGPADIVILFADTVDDVRTRAPSAYASMAGAGRCWIAYRKGASRSVTAGGTPLHRDTMQAGLAETGHDGVTLISLGDVWSAMRIKRV